MYKNKKTSKFSVKKSKHIPKKNSPDRNIIRCIILSIDERSRLSSDMIDVNFDKKRFSKLIEVLIKQNIIEPLDKNKEIVDTLDLVISDYEKADYYVKNNFYKSLERIEKDLVPFLNLISACLNFAAIAKK